MFNRGLTKPVHLQLRTYSVYIRRIPGIYYFRLDFFRPSHLSPLVFLSFGGLLQHFSKAKLDFEDEYAHVFV